MIIDTREICSNGSIQEKSTLGGCVISNSNTVHNLNVELV